MPSKLKSLWRYYAVRTLAFITTVAILAIIPPFPINTIACAACGFLLANSEVRIKLDTLAAAAFSAVIGVATYYRREVLDINMPSALAYVVLLSLLLFSMGYACGPRLMRINLLKE